MVYNREVLTTDISSSILTLTEQAKTEPVIPALSAALLQPIAIPPRPESPSANREWGAQFQKVFEAYVAHVMAYYKAIVAHAGACERIMEELRMQSLAVQVALTNLDAHSQSVLETFEKFNAFAVKEFAKQARLLQSFPRDIEALRHIRVHAALLPANSPEKYISDFIPTDKLIVWAERCREIHESLQKDEKDLSLSIKEVQEGTLAIRSNSGINLEQLEDAMAEIIQTVEQQSQIRHRVERDQGRVKERLSEISKPGGFAASGSTLEALEQLAVVYRSDYMDSSREADTMLREKLSIFLSAKRSQTANLISQLMHISKLQSTIASIPPSLGSLDESLRRRDTDFSQLVYVQRIPIAYGALVVEIVRRREYSKLLVQKSQQLAEVMSRFRQTEQRRRDSFRAEVAKFVPVVVPGLDDVPPSFEINALNTRDRLPPFTRDHVAEFERLVTQLSIALGAQEGNESHVLGPDQSSVGGSSISSGPEANHDALSKLRVTLTKMTAQMDIMSGEFDRILEKSFLTERIQRLEDENARLRSEMSRTDVQQRSGTPQLVQPPFSRQSALAGPAGSVSPSSATGPVGGGLSVIPPTSPKLSRQTSRGSTSTPVAQRMDADDQQQLQQQLQLNQRLSKDNTDLTTKIKAYETRIRSLEETLYQNFRAGSSADSSVSSKDSRNQPAASPGSDQPWKAPEDIQAARSQSQAKEQERRRDEERLLLLEQEVQDLAQKLEQTDAKLQSEYNVNQQALLVNDELRQELLELKLQSATSDEAADNNNVDMVAAHKRSEELEEELKGLTLKYEHLLQHHEKEVEEQAVETKAFKERIEELTNQLGLEKEILEGQLDQAKRTAEEASERATELENELAVVNEELQNKVLELEEELENHAAQHDEVTARAQEQERQLESHRAVHSDILAQLKEQEQRAATALEDSQLAREEYRALQKTHAQFEENHKDMAKTLTDIETAKTELAQQVDALRKQVADLEAQREAYKVDVDLRLEEAKVMVQRAREDWKEKSNLLEQTERATADLAKPIADCFSALSLDHTQVEAMQLEQVGKRLQEIANAIRSMSEEHEAKQAAALKAHEERVQELQKDHETSQDILNSTIATLKTCCKSTEEGAASVKAELDSMIEHLREELENVRVQQRASAIPVPVSTTSTYDARLDSISPATPMPPSLPSGLGEASSSASEKFSVSDRVLLSTLALDLGIPLPSLSAEESSQVLSPTSSVLLENAEKRSKSGSALITPTVVPAGSSSTAVASTGVSSSTGGSRSSSTTVPLPKDVLQSFDFSDLNVAEATALIKKKLSDTEHLLKRWQRECKHLKEKYHRASVEAHEKIAFRNFKVDDLTLFLPTRNSISKPWAAFNINFPHYFLNMTPTMSNQLRNREWIVARITSITEAIVDKRLAEDEDENGASSSTSTAVSPSNPFGLADGVKYYLLDATSWNGYHGHGHGHSKSSSYHSSSGRESSSSGKLRHHSSTSALGESYSSSRRDHDRAKERRDKGKDKVKDSDAEHQSHRARDDGHAELGGSQLKTVEEERLAESSSSVAVGGPSSNPTSPRNSVMSISGSKSSMLSLLQLGDNSSKGVSDSQASLVTAATVGSMLSSTSSGQVSKASASLQQHQGQLSKQRKQDTRDRPADNADTSHTDATSLSAGNEPSSQLPPSGQTGGAAGNRHSMGASGSSPISIPYQSPAANALRAISSSVGSTGSGGSGSVSSLLAHHLGGGSGSGSGSTMAASSPPRTMLVASSPIKTGVSTVSAMGTTVSVNSSSASFPQGHSHSQSHGGSSLSMTSSGVVGSSSVPVHPSRLSTSSNRDELEQLAVFATDEDQEHDREQEQQQQRRVQKPRRAQSALSVYRLPVNTSIILIDNATQLSQLWNSLWHSGAVGIGSEWRPTMSYYNSNRGNLRPTASASTTSLMQLACDFDNRVYLLDVVALKQDCDERLVKILGNLFSNPSVRKIGKRANFTPLSLLFISAILPLIGY
ncbi:oligomeric, coiled-coil, peripheral membrane protein [Mortierella alpina]|nr:oligomeric, coiled-coil, peripheral membrane protein [Mortierella alpina]